MPGENQTTEDPLQWVSIDDFSPGCYSNGGVVVGNSTDRMLSAPLGAADAENTFSCYALPDKSLAALPGITETYVWPANFDAAGNTFLTGLLIHDELGSGDTEAIMIAVYDDGTTHSFQAVSYVLETLTTNQIVLVTGASSPGIFGSPYPAFTRAAASAPTTTPGQPVVVFPSGPPEQPASTSAVYMYPNPSTPTLFTPLNLISGSPGSQTSVAGQLFVHQSRILIFAATDYQWPVGSTFFTNENINFTDPPNSTVLGNQQTVLAAELPFGYGTGGSISAGEFFIVKKRGGALVVTGDIFSPNVTILPGVQPTGNIIGQGFSTPSGFVYCSEDNGAWVWNGGSTSQKISSNLDDGFFLPPEFSFMQSNNYGFYASAFGDKVYFSNNWLWDTRGGGWWPYYPRKNQGGVDLFWVQPVNGNYIYAAQLSFTNSNLNFMYRFDPATSAQTYQWQSVPFRTTDRDHRTDIREIVIRASCSINQTDPFVVEILDHTNVQATLTTSGMVLGPGPQLVRFNAPGGGLSEPAIRVTSTNSDAGDSPIIHSIEVGYRLRAHQSAENA